MRWYDYVFVVAISLSFSVLSYYFSVQESKVRAVDIVSLINEEKARILESEASMEEKELRFRDYLQRLNAVLSGYDGVVFLSQSIVGGKDYVDITEEVRRRLK